jgi:acyl-CoA reductase-like NAD-dependent aldehyde dehydrogenase
MDLEGTQKEVNQCVLKARKAYESWSALSHSQRASHLLRVKDLLISRLDEIVQVICEETGKLSAEAVVNEVVVCSELINFYAKNAQKILSSKKVSPGIFFTKQAEIRYEPKGVIGIISPWNYPLVLSLGPVMTALFAGNTAVLKPSEYTPKVGLKVGELFASLNEYQDIVQVLPADRETGAALVNSDVDMITFTGSVATGKAVMRDAAKTLKPIILELGGKDPMIVLRDANLKRAVKACVWGAFTNAGQTCMAVERVYVEKSIYKEFVDEVVKLTSSLKVGAPDGDVAPMINEKQLKIVEDHVKDAVEKGAQILCGGSRVENALRPTFSPTVVVNVNHSMKIMKEETFGPVLPICKFDTDQEALELANDSPYGLNASVFGTDKDRVEFFVKNLKSGNVCVNDVMVSYALPALPFGGVKQSGFGRTHGELGLIEMCNVKSVAKDRFGLSFEPQWYPITKATKAFGEVVLNLRAKQPLKAIKAAKSLLIKH